MKKLLVLLFLMPSIGLFSQQNTFEVEGLSAKDIIKKSRIWLAEKIKDSRFATELAEEGTIIVNGTFSPEVKNMFGAKVDVGYIEFSLKIEAKEGKYRTTFSDFYHKSTDKQVADGGPIENEKPQGGLRSMQKKIWTQYKEKVPEFISTTEKSLLEAITNKKSDEW